MDTEREWTRVARTSAFQELMRKKKAFLIPATAFFVVFYFGLPILAAYTTVLNAPAIGNLTWAWVYALAQFVMTWSLMHLYLSQANRWDAIVDRARREAAREETGARQQTGEEGA